MMIALPFLFLPAISAFKTGNKAFFHCLQEYFRANPHMNCQVWKMDSSAMSVLALILAVVYMTLTTGIFIPNNLIPESKISQ